MKKSNKKITGKTKTDKPENDPSKTSPQQLPDDLKGGIKALSGVSMEDVKVHYNSEKPAALNSQAYAQGTEISIAAGQETHLPHEAWHVVQQKQGRVQPTILPDKGLAINSDNELEKEKDTMGDKAIRKGSKGLKE